MGATRGNQGPGVGESAVGRHARWRRANAAAHVVTSGFGGLSLQCCLYTLHSVWSNACPPAAGDASSASTSARSAHNRGTMLHPGESQAGKAQFLSGARLGLLKIEMG